MSEDLVWRTGNKKVVTAKLDPLANLSSDSSRFLHTLRIVTGSLEKVRSNSTPALIGTGILLICFEGVFNVRNNLLEKCLVIVQLGFYPIRLSRGSVQPGKQILPVSINELGSHVKSWTTIPLAPVWSRGYPRHSRYVPDWRPNAL